MSVLHRLARRLQNLVQEYYQPGFVDSPAKTATLLDTEDSLASDYIGMVEDPQIIRTIGELEALDPDTLVVTPFISNSPTLRVIPAWCIKENWEHLQLGNMAVIATGEQVRKAQQTLKEQEA